MGIFDNAEEIKDGKFETGGGNFEPIPSNTSLLVLADSIEWTEYEGESMVSITWVVLAPSAYKNRKVFQKIKLFDKDKKKAAKAATMLKAIDMNCGGKIATVEGEVTDAHLMKAIMGKQQVIKVQVWNMIIEGEKKSGNWVCAVAPKSPVPEVENPSQTEKEDIFDAPLDDDIPF